MAKEKKVRIECEGAANLPLEKLEEFQGALKARTKEDLEQLIKSIDKLGFSFPFFAWKDGKHIWIDDGHGRKLALAEMAKRGYTMPAEFPVAFIFARNKDEAKEKLLQLNSKYGTITKEGLIEFIGDSIIDMESFNLPDIRRDTAAEPAEVKYTEKIELIISCQDDTQAAELYGEFSERGLKCKISTL